MPIDNDITVPWSTNVGLGVTAPNHQHVFSLRIDPAVDGFHSTAVYEESHPLPASLGIPDPYGVGYIATTAPLTTAGHTETDISKSRVFKIRNDNIINPTTKAAVAYKIQTLPTQPMLMRPESFNRRRARFAEHPVWITKYRDNELYAAGEFTNQSKSSTDNGGLETWAGRGESVEDADLVFWHTFTLTHNPRLENFPVMPAERISVHLKPAGFFEKNPALDVPPENRGFNGSREVETGKSGCVKL